MKAVSAFVIATLVAAPAAAGEWYVHEANTNTVQAVDVASIRIEGGYRIGWSMLGSAESLEVSPTLSFDYAIDQYRYDCERRTTQRLHSVLYDAEGNVMTTFTNAAAVRPVVPGSVGEGELRIVCGEADHEGAPSETPRQVFLDFRSALRASAGK